MKSIFKNQILSQAELLNVRGGNDEPIRVAESILLPPPPPPPDAQ
jgi:hypothetical protein